MRPRSKSQQKQRVAHGEVDHALARDGFDDATDQSQHGEIGILFARDRVERHAEHQGREGSEQGEDAVAGARPAKARLRMPAAR